MDSPLSGACIFGGSVYITGTLDNTGDTLTLNAATGDWWLAAGKIVGGTVTQSGSKLKYGNSSNNRLDGVTFNGTLDLTANNSYLILENGTAFSGDLDLTGQSADMYLNKTSTLDNGGTITLGTGTNTGVISYYGGDHFT